MYKVLKNFGCNSIRKIEGQEINTDEALKIGNFIHRLIDDGILEEISVDPKPIIAKQKKKRGPRKKV